jgi:hypothetical protein
MTANRVATIAGMQQAVGNVHAHGKARHDGQSRFFRLQHAALLARSAHQGQTVQNLRRAFSELAYQCNVASV